MKKNTEDTKRIFKIDPWILTEESLADNASDFKLSESITSLGNEYMGMRGNFEETYSGDSHQGTYIGGLWYPDKTIVGWWKNGYPKYFGKVINAVNFLGINIKVDGIELDLFKNKPSKFERSLNMKEGVLYRTFTVTLNKKEIHVSTERFISLNQKELCAIKYTITCNQDTDIEVTSYINGDVNNKDANYGEKFWEPIKSNATSDQLFVSSKMKKNNFDVQRFAIGVKGQNEFNIKPYVTKYSSKNLYAEANYKFSLKANTPLTIVKKIVLVNTLNHLESNLENSADLIFKKLSKETYEDLKKSHVSCWEQRWQTCDVKIFGSDLDQQAIRFNLFQLFSTYYGGDERLNIGPKGFTGEKYGGATYWDTEAYCIPLYLKAASPNLTKNLLKYRYNHLEKAKENAKSLGLEGALYPMVTFNGVECHNEWEITFEEIHRNAAIVYAIYNYTNYTGDYDYIKTFGIEIMLEISKFWASRVHYSKIKEKWMIHGVTGPNEYENNVNNNWLTNTMAKWTIEYTLKMVKELKISFERINLSKETLERWKDIAQNMYLPEDKDLGIFVQHDTFLDKEFKEKSLIPKSDLPLNKNWSWDKILRSPYIKQADVLQGIYYLWDNYTKPTIAKNFEFYEKYTVHESSLSPCVHSIIAAKLNLMEKAYEFYKRTARLDLDNYNNDSDEGLHITSMAGSYLTIVEGFGGMIIREGQIYLEPRLPKQWTGYEFRINFRNRILKVLRTKTNLELEIIEGEPLLINIFGENYLIKTNLNIEV
ncbi:family 65 glycosyl hydrolase domain-containing protein [Mesoplasma seiffertii]|uniref:family 65 glycosyl hydrolase domain-containing protein n=1 Tax=Mesoplasma seiffertii TaxID=28224 RepID=UPI00047D531E|nr:family 65 glycosyl hydrolase domain-containing protein [Mesoplasma seiffertii]